MIVCGFAYKKQSDGVHIFNLNNERGAAVISADGSLIETNMDDIENQIVLEYYEHNKQFMEE